MLRLSGIGDYRGKRTVVIVLSAMTTFVNALANAPFNSEIRARRSSYRVRWYPLRPANLFDPERYLSVNLSSFARTLRAMPAAEERVHR
jgi:hypothetical protein